MLCISNSVISYIYLLIFKSVLITKNNLTIRYTKWIPTNQLPHKTTTMLLPHKIYSYKCPYNNLNITQTKL